MIDFALVGTQKALEINQYTGDMIIDTTQAVGSASYQIALKAGI